MSRDNKVCGGGLWLKKLGSALKFPFAGQRLGTQTGKGCQKGFPHLLPVGSHNFLSRRRLLLIPPAPQTGCEARSTPSLVPGGEVSFLGHLWLTRVVYKQK